MKDLVITEKPSVAGDIARVLGGFTRKDDYWESDRLVIAAAVGHLLEISPPEGFEEKRGKWSLKNLPVIPPRFALNPIPKTAPRLKLLQKLLKRKDVSTVINACDAGREGELIFRYIFEFAGCKLPIKRLWLQSMTPQAINTGFQHLRNGPELQPLFDAARCRSEADWLVGINSTRAMTAFNSQEGGFFLTTVGRVQTPTLSIVVNREEAIRQFKPQNYFEIEARFAAANGQYLGRWYGAKGQGPDDKPDRLWDSAQAEAIAAACKGQPAEVHDDVKLTQKNSPLLFDLTSLQREANNRFGFTAKTTLSIAQSLYERHKVLTYPRTNSRYLPEDYQGEVHSVLGALANNMTYQALARQIEDNRWVKPTKRVFDNQKVSDHFAIIPTATSAKNLNEAEQKIYDFVVRRFLAVFFPAAQFEVTTRISTVMALGAAQPFKTEARVLISPGWLAVYGREAELEEGETRDWVSLQAGEKPVTEAIEIEAHVTKPPPRYTEATLLMAMEGAGKTIDDEELRDVMADKGLGTPATRAAIIEGLVAEEYLLREGRTLIPTPKAFQLVTLLRGLQIPELIAPQLTGEWEYKLAQMEKGRIGRAEFMREIVGMTEKIVTQAKNYSHATVEGNFAVLKTPCPQCGGVVREAYRRFSCDKCSFSITKNPGSRIFSPEEVEVLLTQRELGPISGFRSKKQGKPFSARLLIVPAPEGEEGLRLEFDFGNRTTEMSGEEMAQLGEVGHCPKCGGRVLELPQSYACENQLASSKSCDFRTGRVILQQEISPEQAGKLLKDGKTDLLSGFVSQRTRRAFKAFLICGKDGKVGFAFPPRQSAGAGEASEADEAADAKKPASARGRSAVAKKVKAAKADATATSDGAEPATPKAVARAAAAPTRKKTTKAASKTVRKPAAAKL